MQLNTPDNDEDMNCKTDFSFVVCTDVLYFSCLCSSYLCMLHLCWPNKESKTNRIKPTGLSIYSLADLHRNEQSAFRVLTEEDAGVSGARTRVCCPLNTT